MLINIGNIKPLIKPVSLEIGLVGLNGEIEFAILLNKLDILDAIWCLRETDTCDAQFDCAMRIAMRIRHLVSVPSAIDTTVDYYYDIASESDIKKANDLAYAAHRVTKSKADWAVFSLTNISDDCDCTDLLYDVAEGAIDANPEIEQTIKTMLLEVFA